MSKAEKELDREAQTARTAERISAKAERDQKLLEINKKYGPQIDELREKAHNERNKIWAEWRERRDES